jgi:hypothetical protein
MKKCFFALIFTILTGALLQVSAQSNIGFGVKAGVNISSQRTPDEGEFVEMGGLLRINGGAWFNYFITDRFAIQPELLVSGKGSNWDDPNYDVRDLLTYIDLPVLIRYQIIDLLNVHAGPQVGYLLSARQKDNATGDVIKINDYYKKPDLGLVVGIEANLPVNINITVRYVFGLIPTTTEEVYIDPWLNNFFQISAGYRFIGK